MKEIEFLKHLIADADHELKYIELYKEKEALSRSGSSTDQEILWSMRSPSRQRVKDDLKMVRRITLELERRMEQ